MQIRILTLLLLVCISSSSETRAGEVPPADSPTAANSRPSESPAGSDPFDFGGSASKANEETQYVEVDESIKIRVEPVIRSAVVDRILSPSTVTVQSPGAVKVQLYVEPVDSPYCGKALEEPRLIGESCSAKTGFSLAWKDIEHYRYVKLFALVFKNGRDFSRSRSLDFCMGGARLELAEKKTPN